MFRYVRVFSISFLFLILTFNGFLRAAVIGETHSQDQIEIQIPKDPPRSEKGLASATLILDLVIGNEPANESSQFYSLNGIQIGPTGTIYALDRKANRVLLFDSSGKFLRSIGKKGEGPWEWKEASAFCVGLNGQLVVKDSGRKIDLFSASGEPLTEFRLETDYPTAIRMDGRDRYLLRVSQNKDDRIFHQIMIFDSSMKWIKTIPTVDTPRNQIDHFNPYSDIMFFDILPNDNVIWGFSDKYEFHIVGEDGRVSRIIKKNHDFVRLSEKEKNETSKAFSSMPKIQLVFPDFRSAFQWFFVDEKGRLYVTTYEKDSEGRIRIDIFDIDGRFQGKVYHPENEFLYTARGDMLYFIEKESAEGIPLLKRYRLKY